MATNASGEEDAQQHRVDAHRHADARAERLADGRDARHRQRALADRTREQHQHEEGGTPPVRLAHAPDDEREHERQRRRRPAQADAIEDAADRQADRRADERRPQVDVGVGDAIEVQVRQQRLGDEPQTLRAAGQRREHHDRGDDDVDPAEADRARVGGPAHAGGRKSRRWCGRHDLGRYPTERFPRGRDVRGFRRSLRRSDRTCAGRRSRR